MSRGFFEFCRKSFCTVNGQGRFSQKGTASHSRMKSAVVDGIKSLFLFCLTEEFSRRNFLRRMAGHRAKRGSTKKAPTKSMLFLWGEIWDSNPWPSGPQPDALTNCANPTVCGGEIPRWRALGDSNPRPTA